MEYEMIVEMAKEIGRLREDLDSEYGEYNEEDYKVENIIKAYYNYCKGK